MDGKSSRAVTLLHVSDFHFRHGDEFNFDRTIVLDPLIEEIKTISNDPDWRPELVLCTGDIAYSGTPPDYEAAETFISHLLDNINLKKEQFFVVPGNHDIDATNSGTIHQLVANKLSFPSYDQLRDKLLHLSHNYSEFLEITNRLFDTEEIYSALLKKFWGYCNFTEHLGRRFGKNPYAFTEVVPTRSGLLLGIIGLNSAWLFANKGKALEQMQQFIGMRPLLKASDSLKTKQEEKGSIDLTVGMVHHPTDWLYEAERGPVTKMLAERLDLLLQGHQDAAQQNFFLSEEGTKKTLVLQEGPAYEGSHYPSRIEFIRCEVSDERKAIEVKPLMFDSASRRWIADTRVFAAQGKPNGHGHFTLWEAPRIREPVHIAHWEEFYNACHKFEKQGRFYILVAGETLGSSAEKSALARVDWSLVLDFDPDTDVSGLYKEARKELAIRRSLHLLTFEDQVSLEPEVGTYWIAARGLRDRPSTLVDNTWLSWNRKYSQALRALLQCLANSTAEQRPITVVILWHKAEYIRTVCEAIDSIFRSSVEFVFGTTYKSQVSAIVDSFGAKLIPIALPDVCHGLNQMIMISPRLPETELPAFPSLNGLPVTLSQEILRWLEENLEVVHLGTGKVPEEDSSPGSNFYRGGKISWFELAMHFDVDREKTLLVQQQVMRDLESRSTKRINLYHWPGSGGTTVARRIAWNLHTFFPTVLLRRITGVSGQEIVERLRELFEPTQKPILVVVEAADVKEGDLEALYSETLTRPFPVTFLQVTRHFVRTVREGERVFFLDSTLSLPEATRFVETYAREAPTNRSALRRVVSGDPTHRSPFYFGLTAFERDFVALDDYVRCRLKTATEVQKQIITFMALVYSYAHRATPVQLFTKLLGLPDNHVLVLEQVLSDALLDLLVCETSTMWRPSHELIAEEISQQVLSGDAPDRRIWKQNLSAWAKDFADICADRPWKDGEELRSLLRRLYIEREHQELLGVDVQFRQRYSRLLEDVPPEGRTSLLTHLTELFPEEPHFWAHLGRCLMAEMKDDVKALDAITRAISLNDQDYVLYHIKGMILSQQLLGIMRECKKIRELTPEALKNIKRLVEEAGEEFAKSRELERPEDEFGYVSHIDLLLHVVDFGFEMSRGDSRAAFISSAEATWYRDLLDTAAGLLEDLEQIRPGEEPSFYLARCKSLLRQQYGDFISALQNWSTLLVQPGIYRPLVRRQIVRTYLTKASRIWDRVPQSEVDHILSLMEDNIKEEPVNDKNIRLWFQAARRSDRYTTDEAIEHLSYWRVNTEALEATFYLYILHTMQALEGSVISVSKARDLINESSQKARQLRTRVNSIEWYGKGKGLRRLVHHRSLGAWPGAWEKEFEKGEKLALVEGRIANINTPASGELELPCGLKAFFVPRPSRGYHGKVYTTRDLNRSVKFYLAFSYDGLRGWSVRDVEEASSP